MSHSATTGGGALDGARNSRSIAPPGCSERRKLRRGSIRARRAVGAKRRVRRRRRAWRAPGCALRASSISAALIWAKSFARRISSSDTVKRASRSSDGTAFGSSAADLNSASATRLAPASAGLGLRWPGACGDIIAISFSSRPLRFQKISNAWSNSRLCSCFLTNTACSVAWKSRAVAEARRLDRGERVEHRARPERHAGLAQRAGEMDDVLRQSAAVSGAASASSLMRAPTCPGTARTRSGSAGVVHEPLVDCAAFRWPRGEIGLHRREIEIPPAAVLVIRLPVGHAVVTSRRQSRSGFGRLEVDDDRRIRIGVCEFAGAPGLDDASGRKRARASRR